MEDQAVQVKFVHPAIEVVVVRPSPRDEFVAIYIFAIILQHVFVIFKESVIVLTFTSEPRLKIKRIRWELGNSGWSDIPRNGAVIDEVPAFVPINPTAVTLVLWQYSGYVSELKYGISDT